MSSDDTLPGSAAENIVAQVHAGSREVLALRHGYRRPLEARTK